MGIFAGSDTRRNRVISIRGPPGLQGIRGLKEDTGPQSPNVTKMIKEILGMMERQQWPPILLWLIVK